jgi:hypothetical protein
MAVDALKHYLSTARNGQTCRGVPAPAERSRAGDLDLSTVVKRKRTQHHWSKEGVQLVEERRLCLAMLNAHWLIHPVAFDHSSWTR